MTTSPSDGHKIDAVWIDDCPDEVVFFGCDFATEHDQTVYFQWDGKNPFVRVKWITYDEFVQMAKVNDPNAFTPDMEIGHVENFRFIESPVVPQHQPFTEAFMKSLRHIASNTKLGRRLNSKKVKRGSWAGVGRTGEKELERGARSYMAASKTNGYPIVQTMSKKQFDRDVEYHFGEGE